MGGYRDTLFSSYSATHASYLDADDQSNEVSNEQYTFHIVKRHHTSRVPEHSDRASA